MGRACIKHGAKRNAYRILVGRHLGRPRRKWDDNIKMDLREIGYGSVDSIILDRNRDQELPLVNKIMNHKML
jgi:hypothetical protein